MKIAVSHRKLQGGVVIEPESIFQMPRPGLFSLKTFKMPCFSAERRISEQFVQDKPSPPQNEVCFGGFH